MDVEIFLITTIIPSGVIKFSENCIIAELSIIHYNNIHVIQLGATIEGITIIYCHTTRDGDLRQGLTVLEEPPSFNGLYWTTIEFGGNDNLRQLIVGNFYCRIIDAVILCLSQRVFDSFLGLLTFADSLAIFNNQGKITPPVQVFIGSD